MKLAKVGFWWAGSGLGPVADGAAVDDLRGWPIDFDRACTAISSQAKALAGVCQQSLPITCQSNFIFNQAFLPLKGSLNKATF